MRNCAKAKKVAALLCLAVSVLICCPPFALAAARVEVIGSEQGLRVEGDTPLFYLDNIAAGASKEAVVTVKNAGREAFACTLSARMDSGDRRLFEGLLFEVFGAGGDLLYSGPLSELQDITVTGLEPGGSEELRLKVLLPLASGNELKDLFLDLALVFEISSDAPAPDLPQTGGQLLYSLLGILLCLLLALLADMHSRRRRRMRTSG
ncbi:MAG: hypothetical protein GX890_05705 [Firmicutes bacterium]|jgi:hypothetical protein|nr:hypothetical protein [Bacillota bacterium]HPU01465.1 hypothetical protein [Bacillota bacterium]